VRTSQVVRGPAPVVTTNAASLRNAPVFIGVLGTFVLLKAGRPVTLRPGGRIESLLTELALRGTDGVPRDELLATMWPATAPSLAGHSLNELVSSLHRKFSDVLDGDGPVTRSIGAYAINLSAGVGVDIAAFEDAADAGEASLRAGDVEAARRAYAEASSLYRGDLWTSNEVRHVVDRERLRMRFMSLASALAEWLFREGNYRGALARVLDLLAHDPCREDAHRLAIRCYMRLGERAQALRQYRVCRAILNAEFDAEPEEATTTLYDQVRLSPSSI
jgi:DNA-binding SARP family transcriptional activator